MSGVTDTSAFPIALKRSSGCANRKDHQDDSETRNTEYLGGGNTATGVEMMFLWALMLTIFFSL